MTDGGSNFGLDRLLKQFFAAYEPLIRSAFDHNAKTFDSPIENLMFIAVGCGLRLTFMSRPSGALTMLDSDDFEAAGAERGRIYCKPQARVLDWRADFLVVVVGEAGTVYRAVIECDGHDFHERTKEQAMRDRSRDRRLQGAGCRIFRFTGAEIYRDPLACGMEVARWAQQCFASDEEGTA